MKGKNLQQSHRTDIEIYKGYQQIENRRVLEKGSFWIFSMINFTWFHPFKSAFRLVWRHRKCSHASMSFRHYFFQQLKCIMTSDTIFEKIAPCKTIIIQFLSVKIIKYGIYENFRFWKRHLVRRYFNFEVILWMALFRDAIRLIQ